MKPSDHITPLLLGCVLLIIGVFNLLQSELLTSRASAMRQRWPRLVQVLLAFGVPFKAQERQAWWLRLSYRWSGAAAIVMGLFLIWVAAFAPS